MNIEMTNDEILQAAKEVGAVIDVLMLGRHDNTVFTTGELERFAAIIEKRIIERCAEKLLSIGALGDGDFLAEIRAIPTGRIKLEELL